MSSLRSVRGNARKQKSQVAAAVVELLECRQLLSTPPVTFADTDGDKVTVQLSGAGTVEVVPGNRNVEVSGTNVASVLTISVKRAAHGDGLVTLGELRCYGPMRSINAPNANITHEISIDDLNLPVSKNDKVSMNLNALIRVAVYTGPQRIGTLRLADWSAQEYGGELNTPSIDAIITTGRKDVPGTAANEYLPGNCNVAMNVGDGSTTARTWSIGSINVAGALGDIQTAGRVGNIVAGQIRGQLTAASFSSISTKAAKGSAVATGTMFGNILATGSPRVRTSIGTVYSDSDVTSMSIATRRGDIGQVTVKGELLNSSIQSGGAIQSANIGNFDVSRIQSLNDVGSIQVGEITNSVVQVGVASTFSGTATSAADFANPSARLGSFTVAGIRGKRKTAALVSDPNVISAAKVGTISLRNLASTSSMQMYVLDRKGPSWVSDTQVGDPASSFSWQIGHTMPVLLAEMLHYV